MRTVYFLLGWCFFGLGAVGTLPSCLLQEIVDDALQGLDLACRGQRALRPEVVEVVGQAFPELLAPAPEVNDFNVWGVLAVSQDPGYDEPDRDDIIAREMGLGPA